MISILIPPDLIDSSEATDTGTPAQPPSNPLNPPYLPSRAQVAVIIVFVTGILLINGPNLGMLGRREPCIYGTDTLADIETAVSEEVAESGWKVLSYQHDCEGELIRVVQDNYDTVGAIINPGALMIHGWSLRDALANYPRPWIEVHLSNIWARESFRHESVLAPLASGMIAGLGSLGYRLAAKALLEMAVSR